MTSSDNRAQQLCFTARALAQTHPLSSAAYDYRRSFITEELLRQPNKDFVDWASNCLLVGYCLRRAEENSSGVSQAVSVIDPVLLRTLAGEVAAEISSGCDDFFLIEPSVMLTALDRLISTELDKRWETAQEHASQQDWALIEEYLAWSLLHGYCLRVIETRGGK
ncbi:MAG: hypothetical protein ACO3CX_04760 [Ilumatobacteraceae bacterium]